MVDELLHLLKNLFLLGEAALAVDDVHRTIGDGIDGLAEDLEALAHLLDADKVAVVAVANRPDRDVEIILLVIKVGMGLADIVFNAGSAEHRSGQAVGDGILLGDDADVLGAVDEDRVAGEQVGDLVEGDREAVQEGTEHCGELLGQVADLSADAGVARGESGPGQELAEVVDLLALSEGVEEDGDRPDVHGAGPETEEVGRDAGHLAADDADRLASGREFPTHQFFDSQGVGDVVGEGGEVVESVRVGDELVVLHVLGDLLVAAMQVADHRLGLHDQLAVEVEDDLEDPVRGGVGGTEIQRHGLPEQFARWKMGSMLLDGLLGAARRVGGLENGARAHGR